ncbi:hypothetical protein ACFLSZ_03010 [Candidatus Bipolaricaulota bacterium]
MENVHFGSDVTIPETRTIEGAEKKVVLVEVWGIVTAIDTDGFTVDGIKKGDLVEVVDLSGICSFSKGKNDATKAALIGIANGLLQDSIKYFTEDQAQETQQALNREMEDIRAECGTVVPHKRRDGYGRDPGGSQEFAKHEGGVIICMPKARGAVYATSDMRLRSGCEKTGRLPTYFSDKCKNLNCWFPCRETGGMMETKAEKDGAMHVLAFDNYFPDNAGQYSIKLTISRDVSGMTATEARATWKEMALGG